MKRWAGIFLVLAFILLFVGFVSATSGNAGTTEAIGQDGEKNESCVTNNVSFSVFPTRQSVKAGDTLTYNLEIKNNDFNCSPRTFMITIFIPFIINEENAEIHFFIYNSSNYPDGERRSNGIINSGENPTVKMTVTSKTHWPAGDYRYRVQLNYGPPGEKIELYNYILGYLNQTIISNSTLTTCGVPACDGRQDTGKKDDNGCAIYICQTKGYYDDMNSCLDSSSTNYWDQQKNKCYEGFNDKIMPLLCSDPDGGINKYESAHTFGFRSNFADSRDQRIRTGGKDGCYSKVQLSENYCDAKGFIKTTAIDCPNGCEDGKCIKGEFISEQITCIFKNSDKEQECYLAAIDQKEVTGCKGEESCSFKFNSEKGEKVTWKSSCGGYAFTLQDGNDEEAVFNCGVGETTPGKLVNNGFMTAYWECYDGGEYKDSSEQCKPFLDWQKQATQSCENKCSNNNNVEKCGVNSFSVVGECYVEVEPFVNSSTGSGSSDDDFCNEYLKECKLGDKAVCEKWEINCQEVKIAVCKDSCSLDNKCYPFGYRKSGNYCSDSGAFTEQLKSESQCDNNFECGSNLCVSNQCVSESLIEKIINWFKKLFGSE